MAARTPGRPARDGRAITACTLITVFDLARLANAAARAPSDLDEPGEMLSMQHRMTDPQMQMLRAVLLLHAGRRALILQAAGL